MGWIWLTGHMFDPPALASHGKPHQGTQGIWGLFLTLPLTFSVMVITLCLTFPISKMEGRPSPFPPPSAAGCGAGLIITCKSHPDPWSKRQRAIHMADTRKVKVEVQRRRFDLANYRITRHPHKKKKSTTS